MTHMTLTCFVISEKMSISTMKKEDISMQHSILNTVTAISFFTFAQTVEIKISSLHTDTLVDPSTYV